VLIQWLWLKKKIKIITGRKINLLKIIEKGEKKKHEIAKNFVIPANTLSTIIKNKDVILKIFNFKLINLI